MNTSSALLRMKQEAIEATKAIRKKFSDFKRDKSQAQLAYRTHHQQIVKPLEDIANVIVTAKRPKNLSAAVKKEPKREIKRGSEEDDQDAEEEDSEFEDAEDDSEYMSDDEESGDLQESESETRLHEYPNILQHYAKLLSHESSRHHDPASNLDLSRYAIHYNISTDKWTMAKSFVTFDKDDLIIKGKRYNGTPGLYALLTLKKVDLDSITDEDIDNYINIVRTTNAHRLKYLPKGRVAKTTTWKYTNLLVPYLKQSTANTSASSEAASAASGQGIGNLKLLNTNKPIEYVFWNTPSELVQRLRLLYASASAGNNSKQNMNEIQSIISELYEDGIIA